MNPDSMPGSWARNAGSPDDRSGFTIRSSRRSASPASVASTMPITSSASAIGWPWKLPPERISPSITNGLSVAALSSVVTSRSANANPSPTAPRTCGVQRSEYASWTRESFSRCDSRISESASRARSSAADRCCWAWGRASWIRWSNGTGVPRTASRLIAAAACAVRHSTQASCTSSAASPVWACVPLTKASPSFASSVIGWSPLAKSVGPSSPSPIMASARCARGVRSPDAPTLPCEGTRGCTCAFNMPTISSGRTARTPLVPRSSTLARSSIIARTASTGSGSPTPDAWLRIRFRCRSRACSGLMRT